MSQVDELVRVKNKKEFDVVRDKLDRNLKKRVKSG